MTPRNRPAARAASALNRNRRQSRERDRHDLSFDPVEVRPRHDGWTPQRQIDFVEALAASGCVTEAAKSVGMSTETAYALRRRFDAQPFRLAWDAALDYAIRRLSDVAFSRAINGDVIPHYYKGELVGEHRRYDSALTRFLLRYRDPLRYGRSLDKESYNGTDEFFALRLASALNDIETGEGRIERSHRVQQQAENAARRQKDIDRDTNAVEQRFADEWIAETEDDAP